MRARVGWLSLSLAAAVGAMSCSDSSPITPEGAGGQGAGQASGAGGSGASAQGAGGQGGSPSQSGGGGSSGQGGAAPCPSNVTCVASFPFSEQRDTQAESASAIDAYDCAPDTNESGPEIYYRVTVPSAGFLSAAVYDDEGTDIDVQILTSFNPAAPTGTSCVDRGDHHARADVGPGDVWIVADTWTNSGGTPQSGAFKIDIGFVPVPEGPCDMQSGEMARVGDGGTHLAMPATGPVVMEAHLVTQAEPAPFPATATDELAAHYELSQAATGLVMFRTQVWAPLEGGKFYGAGIGDPALFPVVDEGWYVNMYWTPAARPPRGTRMILRRPDDPTRAVVVAAGYETGPGDLSEIGGTPEETHFYLRTQHESALTLGIAQDQSLPFGPRKCTN